jgi:hypothetical protein
VKPLHALKPKTHPASRALRHLVRGITLPDAATEAETLWLAVKHVHEQEADGAAGDERAVDGREGEYLDLLVKGGLRSTGKRTPISMDALSTLASCKLTTPAKAG